MPQRRCVGCGRVAPKPQLVRVVARRRLAVVDQTGTLPGRGAYLCREQRTGRPSRSCLELATRRRGLSRGLRCSVALGPDLLELTDR